MTKQHVLLVGEDFGNSAPEYHHDAYALTGASGRRLVSLAGYQGPNAMLLYALDFARTNVVVTADQWKDRELVGAGYRRVSEMADEYLHVVLLGRRVARAFGLQDQRLFDFVDHVAVMPHPSGRSHWWNDPGNERRARAFMRSLRAAT